MLASLKVKGIRGTVCRLRWPFWERVVYKILLKHPVHTLSPLNRWICISDYRDARLGRSKYGRY